MPPNPQITYREAKPEDKPSLASINSSFTTNTIYTVTAAPPGSLGFTLTETLISPPLTKHFPDDSSDSDSECETDPNNNTSSTSKKEKDKNKDKEAYNYTYTLLASDASTSDKLIVGFISTSYSAWNKRLIITDIEINPSHRGQGIGRELINRAEKHAVSTITEYAQAEEEEEEEEEEEKLDIKYLWLEVSSVNAPAIKSYSKMGFEVCGLDVSLYEGTEAKGEIAVFMWRKCQSGVEG